MSCQENDFIWELLAEAVDSGRISYEEAEKMDAFAVIKFLGLPDEDYPLGGCIEPYDIEVEKELTQE